MDIIEKYYKEIMQIIEEAQRDGVEISAYSTKIGNEHNMIEVDNGIIIGANTLKSGKYKKISTWKD